MGNHVNQLSHEYCCLEEPAPAITDTSPYLCEARDAECIAILYMARAKRPQEHPLMKQGNPTSEGFPGRARRRSEDRGGIEPQFPSAVKCQSSGSENKPELVRRQLQWVALSQTDVRHKYAYTHDSSLIVLNMPQLREYGPEQPAGSSFSVFLL
ncbi:hypothetical protein OE88DRAFT_1641113 [Heliocybe sulcata]|uniref:Uncharacterized protein n=1 Tax=Heliocybe sulcata TaxID=5364 RepID=A0A5C3NJ84_9AGAM|nr:hypothetical protein OE88DRAFT_1641113 [Heliocybe sulcata]